MWLITGLFSKKDGPEIEETRLLMVGKKYKLGRGYSNDLHFGAKNSKEWIQLTVKDQVDENNHHLHLELLLLPGNPVQIERDGQQTVLGKHDKKSTEIVIYAVHDGDVISTMPKAKRDAKDSIRRYRLHWKPLCIFGKRLKKNLQESVKRIGGTIVSTSPSDPNVTHAILPSYNLDFRILQLGLQGTWIVNQKWLEELSKKVAYVPLPSTREEVPPPRDQNEEAYYGFFEQYYLKYQLVYPSDLNSIKNGISPLELDFEKNWVLEQNWFPKPAILDVVNDQDVRPKFYGAEFWQRDSERADVFAGYFFLGIGPDSLVGWIDEGDVQVEDVCFYQFDGSLQDLPRILKEHQTGEYLTLEKTVLVFPNQVQNHVESSFRMAASKVGVDKFVTFDGLAEAIVTKNPGLFLDQISSVTRPAKNSGDSIKLSIQTRGSTRSIHRVADGDDDDRIPTPDSSAPIPPTNPNQASLLPAKRVEPSPSVPSTKIVPRRGMIKKSILDDLDEVSVELARPPLSNQVVPVPIEVDSQPYQPAPTQATQLSNTQTTGKFSRRRKRIDLFGSDSEGDEDTKNQIKKARLEDSTPEIQYRPAPFASSLLDLDGDNDTSKKLKSLLPVITSTPAIKPKVQQVHKMTNKRKVLSDVEEEQASPKKVKIEGASLRKGKGKKTNKADSEQADAQFITINKGRRKVNEIDRELDNEFNNLKITRPTFSDELKERESIKIGWGNDQGLNQDEKEEIESWNVDASTTKFVIKFVDMIKPKRVEAKVVMEEKWKGRPDFKKFISKHSNKVNEPKQRIQLSLVDDQDYEAPTRSMETRPFTQPAKGRVIRKENFVDDSQTADEAMSEEPSAKTTTTKRITKRGATAVPSTARQLKQRTLTAMMDDSEDDDEGFSGFSKKRQHAAR